MNKIKNMQESNSIERDFHFFNYSVQHMESVGKHCILYCTNKEKEYAEMVIKNAGKFDNEELLWFNRFMFVESISAKEKQRHYTIVYQDTQNTTKVLADSFTLHPSSYDICEASRYAINELKKNQMGLPSVITALILLENKNGTMFIAGIKERVKEKIDIFTSWGTENAENEQKLLYGKKSYVLMAQCIQEIRMLSHGKENLEKAVIQVIEDNHLMRFDEV